MLPYLINDNNQGGIIHYAKNGQKSQCFTIYNEYKQRQTKYSFFYFSNEANNKINRPMFEREHQILEFL